MRARGQPEKVFTVSIFTQACLSRPMGRDEIRWGWVERGGMEGRLGLGKGQVQQILLNPSPLPGPHPPSWVNLDLRKQYHWCRLKFTHGRTLGQGNKYSCTLKKSQHAKASLWDTAGARLAPLHHHAGCYGGLGCSSVSDSQRTGWNLMAKASVVRESEQNQWVWEPLERLSGSGVKQEQAEKEQGTKSFSYTY